MTIEAYLYGDPQETIDRKRARDKRLAEHEANLKEIRRKQAVRRHQKQVKDAINGKGRR